jgi:rhodanese-related sulfurtransferase
MRAHAHISTNPRGANDMTSHSPISRRELAGMLDRDSSVAVVEALPQSYFDEAHLPGARNLPHDSDEATIAEVLSDRDRAVVVYCSNLECPNSTILSRRLAQLGYSDVREYEAGKQDWIDAGLGTESSVLT